MPRTRKTVPLSPDRILRAAVKFADRNGIESLNMRRLAGLLDTGAMSLYHYFANKDELLDAMVEFVAAKIHRPMPNEPWKLPGPAVTMFSCLAVRGPESR